MTSPSPALEFICCPAVGAPRGVSVRSAHHPDWFGSELDTGRERPFVGPRPSPHAQDTIPAWPQCDRNVPSAHRGRRSPAPDFREQYSRRSLRDPLPRAAKKPAAAIILPSIQHIWREGEQKMRSASMPGPLSIPSRTRRRISSSSTIATLRLRVQSRSASRMTSLVLAYSPLTTASRTAPTISGGSAILTFSTFAICTSAIMVAIIHTERPRRGM
jgi:hypothetical protein